MDLDKFDCSEKETAIPGGQELLNKLKDDFQNQMKVLSSLSGLSELETRIEKLEKIFAEISEKQTVLVRRFDICMPTLQDREAMMSMLANLNAYIDRNKE